MAAKTLDQPFEVTKAVDFSDEQILATWVDLPGIGFSELVNLRSPMPLMLLGGKGSGRTHLMRYYSYPLQKIRRGSADIASFLHAERYIGIFMRCEGMNAWRFEGKGHEQHVWDSIFAYYMDLWLAELALLTLSDAFEGVTEYEKAEAKIALEITRVFDSDPPLQAASINDVLGIFATARREIDRAVNNSSLRRTLSELKIQATPGRLVFRVPQIFLANVASLREVQIVYLIDELENLATRHQIYLNTLLREKQAPCTFKIGSRLYGFRTQETFSAGEVNRIDSEFEQIILDDVLRAYPEYDQFARDLIAQRLRQSGYDFPGAGTEFITTLFEVIPDSPYAQDETLFVSENYGPSEKRPYFTRLRDKLIEASRRSLAPGVSNSKQIQSILSNLYCDDYPLLEKANAFLLYRDWHDGLNLAESAENIRESCAAYLGEKAGGERHKTALAYFKGDLLAQLLRDCKQDQRYLGVDAFIAMSSGLPRNLLTVLKFVHRWARFFGEEPFKGHAISKRAQTEGVLEAANWFFEDARTAGNEASAVQAAIERLAAFMRALRFSDKPVESSLCTFSVNEVLLSERERAVLKHAHDVSLLLRIQGGQKERNDTGVSSKYQLNPMLSPRYDLPLSRRGAIELSTDEAAAIFGERAGEFDKILRARVSRMNAPFQRHRRRKESRGGGESRLPGFEEHGL